MLCLSPEWTNRTGSSLGCLVFLTASCELLEQNLKTHLKIKCKAAKNCNDMEIKETKIWHQIKCVVLISSVANDASWFNNVLALFENIYFVFRRFVCLDAIQAPMDYPLFNKDYVISFQCIIFSCI